MARKLWSELTETYRNRLVRGGITEASYNSGTSLSAARGHSQTPEHPEEAYKGKNAEKYAGYRFRRDQRRRAHTRKSAKDRAADYFNLPEWQRKKPYWPGNEEAEFWREYQKLGGSGKAA